MIYQIEFELPMLPRMPNALLGAHWRTRSGNKAKILRLVHLVTLGKRPKVPFEHATLVLRRYSSVEPDYDGLAGSFKPVIDALKNCKIIRDDSPSVIGIPTYCWEKCPPKRGKINVTVWGSE